MHSPSKYNFARTFLFFFSAYRVRTIVVICLLVLAGLAEAIGVAAFLPFLQIVMEGKGTSAHLPEGRISDFLTATGITLDFVHIGAFIAAAIGAKAIISWLAMRKVSHTVAVIASDLRARLMRALLRANWRFFTGHALGESLNSIVMETFMSSMAFVSTTRFFSSIIQFTVYASAAFLLSWKIFIGGLFVGGILVVALWGLVRVARRAGMQQAAVAKVMLTHMADMLQGIKPLRAMALEKKFLDQLQGHSAGLERAQIDQLTSAQSMRIFHEPLMVITAVVGIYLAMTYGGLASSELALMAILFIRLLTGMNNVQGEYQRLVTQESTLWSLIDSIERIEKSADNWFGHDNLPEKIGRVEIRDVGFAHGNKQILSHAQMVCEAHTMTALVGASGSGKTTILDLLSGFYMPDQGAILINGQPFNRFALDQWRRTLGFVPQEVFLFNDSILENILMGRKDYGEADVWRALESAGAKEFVESLPQGIHAPVGENGRMLSGGQRQRIAIARAIVHRPQILLLDEATSALDRQTERVLLETLKKLAGEMIVIFVSHNHAVLDYADKIYKIHSGQIEEVVK